MLFPSRDVGVGTPTDVCSDSCPDLRGLPEQIDLSAWKDRGQVIGRGPLSLQEGLIQRFSTHYSHEFELLAKAGIRPSESINTNWMASLNVDYISRKHLYHRSVILGLAAREVVGVLAANGLVPYEAQLNAAKLGLKYHLGDFAERLISGDEKPFHLSNDPRRTDIYHRLVDLGVDKKIAYASAYIPKGAAKYADFLRSTETGKVMALPDELKASLVCLPQDGLKSKWKELNELIVSTLDHVICPSAENLISWRQKGHISSAPEFYCTTPTEGLVSSALSTKTWGFVKDERDGVIKMCGSYSPETLNGNGISSLIDVSTYLFRSTCDLIKIALDPGSSKDSEVFMRDFVYDCLK